MREKILNYIWIDEEIDDMIQKVGLTGDVAGVDVERERTFVDC